MRGRRPQFDRPGRFAQAVNTSFVFQQPKDGRVLGILPQLLICRRIAQIADVFDQFLRYQVVLHQLGEVWARGDFGQRRKPRFGQILVPGRQQCARRFEGLYLVTRLHQFTFGLEKLLQQSWPVFGNREDAFVHDCDAQSGGNRQAIRSGDSNVQLRRFTRPVNRLRQLGRKVQPRGGIDINRAGTAAVFAQFTDDVGVEFQRAHK